MTILTQNNLFAILWVGAKNTLDSGKAAPVSMRFFYAPSFMGQMSHIVRYGCTAIYVFLTSVPPYALKKAKGGFINSDRSMKMSTSALMPVAFHGATLSLVSINNKPYAAVKPVCDGIGLAWSAQYQKIKNDPVLGSTMSIIDIVAEDGKKREMVCLPLDKLSGWLFKVDARRVHPQIREKLIAYQFECYDALNSYWNGKAEQASYAADLKVPLAGSSAQYVKDYAKRHMKAYGEAVKRGQPNILPDEIPLEVLQGIVVEHMRQFRMFTWFDSDQMKLCHQVIGRNETVIDLNDEKKVRCMILDGIPQSMYPMILGVISDYYTEVAKVKRKANDMPMCATPITRGLI